MKKRKLNIIDIIVILAVIAIIGVVALKFIVVDNKSGLGVKDAYKNVEYVLMINNVRNMTAEALSVGDKVYDNKKGTYMGTIKEVKIEPYKLNELNNSGELVTAEKTGYYSVLVTVDSSVVDKNNGLYLSGTLDLKINSEYELHTKLVKTSARVKSVAIIE